MAKKFLGLRVMSSSTILVHGYLTTEYCRNRYFGWAKDIPSVRELFQRRKNKEEEENQALAFYKKFMSQGLPYYCDLDENDGTILQYQRAAEEE
ncbi:hypothetical protein C0989_002031, partial [Termitomyces sp. Mn162]